MVRGDSGLFLRKKKIDRSGDSLSQSGSHYRGIAISKPVDNHFCMVTVQPIEGYEMSKLYGNVLRNGIRGTSSITTAITSYAAKLDVFDTTVNAAPAGTLMAISPHVDISGTMVAVYVYLLPVRSPTVALETLISLTVKPVTAISKVKVTSLKGTLAFTSTGVKHHLRLYCTRVHGLN